MFYSVGRSIVTTLLLLCIHTSLAAEEWPDLDHIQEMPCPAGSEWRTDYFEDFLYSMEGLDYGDKWVLGRGHGHNVHGQNGLEMQLKQNEDSRYLVPPALWQLSAHSCSTVDTAISSGAEYGHYMKYICKHEG